MNGGRWRVQRGSIFLREKRVQESFPWALKRVAIDEKRFERRKLTQPDWKRVHLVTPDRERMQMFKRRQLSWKRVDARRVRDQHSQVRQAGNEDGDGAYRV